MRKRSLILSLILLLLIGGGGVVFYSHLRQQGRPQFSELSRFLLRELPPSEWIGIEGGEWNHIDEGSGWLNQLGIDRSKEVTITQFIAVNPQDQRHVAQVDVMHDAERIIRLHLNPVSDDRDGRFSRMILERYPRLEPIFSNAKGVP